MQFVCDQCRTKYEIEEGRLRGKALKIRCRSCGNVIELRDPGPAKKPDAGAKAAPPPPPRKPEPAKPAASGSLGERFQRAFEGKAPAAGTPGPAGLGAPAPAEEATHIMVSPLLKGSDSGPPSDITRKLARWHVSIRNQPMGPMSEEAIRRHIEDGAVHAGSLAWREGFDEWRPLHAIAELRYLLETKSSGRESVFDLPPMAKARASVAPPPAATGQYIINGIVAVVAFALGMLFMYVLGSGRSEAPAAPVVVTGAVLPSAGGEPGVAGALPTITSGSLTITLTNPTLVQEPAAPAAGAAPSGGGRRTSGGRSSGGSTGGSSGGTDGGSGAYVPSQDLGPSGGTIQTGGGGGTVAIGGGGPRPLSTDQILPVVQQGQSGIQLCYNQARARDFVADLSMRLTIEIAPDGGVNRVDLSSEDYVTQELNDCIVQRVERWRFPRATATTRVALPFAFHQR